MEETIIVPEIKEKILPAQGVILEPIKDVPESAWVALGIGDENIMENALERARMMNILQFFLDDNPGTNINFAIKRMSYVINQLGVPPLGLNRLDQMYKFVTIQRNSITRPNANIQEKN